MLTITIIDPYELKYAGELGFREDECAKCPSCGERGTMACYDPAGPDLGPDDDDGSGRGFICGGLNRYFRHAAMEIADWRGVQLRSYLARRGMLMPELETIDSVKAAIRLTRFALAVDLAMEAEHERQEVQG